MAKQQRHHPGLNSYISIAEGIAKTFGEYCEVVLHDLSDYSSSIVAIFNNHVSGREVGSPITNLGLEVIRKGVEGHDDLINYSTTLNQKNIKSSSMFIRDADHKVIGCLCINIDTDYLKMAHHVLESLITTEPVQQSQESFSPSINDLQTQLINEAIEYIGKPLSLMDKTDREQFIAYLDHKGLFLIKGALQKVADLLNVSKYTMYNYLERGQTRV